MKSKFVIGFLCGALFFGTMAVFASQYTATDNPFPIKLNGQPIELEGYNINDNTYFKLRDIGDKLGFDVNFQDDTVFITTDTTASQKGGIEAVSGITTRLSDKGNTKIIAHRGLSSAEQENTNAAFIAAGNHSYYGTETDVHVTADGKFVVFHDDETGRLTEQNLKIEESTYNDLKKLLLYDFDEGVYRSDLVIPQLHEYIRICKKYNKAAVLELKNRIPADKIEEITMQLQQEGYLENTVFISFIWDNLIDLKKIRPQQKMQYLIADWDDSLYEQLKTNGIGVDMLFTNVTKELVDNLHKNGIEINCWTCDSKEEAEKLISWGVDYITTNILE